MMDKYEQLQNYKLHRLRVLNATSLVNSQAPKPKPKDLFVERRELTFIEMMRSLFTQGNQRTFTKSPVRSVKSVTDNLNGLEGLSLRDRQRMSETTTSSITLKSYHKPKQRASKKDYMLYRKGPPLTSIPQHVLQRYEHLKFIKNSQLLLKLLRPKIYLDLELCHGQPLGRLVIQLYTEACPEVVLHFISICSAEDPIRFKITRLFCHMWLEAELMLNDKNALAVPNIEHDPLAINHGSSAGILSIPSRYLRGSKFQFINFTISFKPIEALNGKRIAFGIVRRGQYVLDQLQNYEVYRNGKPLQQILVKSCGVL